MTAVTPTLVQEHHMPSTVKYGSTERRLTKIYVEVTSAATSNTLNLATYVPNLAAIVAISEMLDGAQNGGTANTWSTTTITLAGHAGSGVWVLEVLGYYT
jgi:hypothetical protein